jgi:hypothetical protein
LLWQGFQHDIAAGDSVALTGPVKEVPSQAVQGQRGQMGCGALLLEITP